MTGVRARLKRILGINPETPGTMRYPKKSWSLLIPVPDLCGCPHGQPAGSESVYQQKSAGWKKK